MMRSTVRLTMVIAASLFLAGIFTEPSVAQSRIPKIALRPPITEDLNPHARSFQERDSNDDGTLTEDEYVIGAGRERKLVRREFKVFDADGDARMSLNEFLTVPIGQPERQRGVIDDPVVQLAQKRLTELMDKWSKWDTDEDSSLNSGEFESARMGLLVPGLESIAFRQWDQDANYRISPADVALTLEIAYGVKTRGGALLRNNCGLIVDYITFSRLKISDDGIVSKADYFAALGGIEGKDGWMNSIDKNRDGQFDYAEFATGNHRTDPVGSFLGLDKDLNGFLSLQELDGLPDEWRRMATCSFQGFDDDHDGAISLREYQMMPHSNWLAPWPYAIDTNNDGELPQFRFAQGVFLAALSAEYFRRLDVDGSKTLTLNEFPFVTTFKPPNELYVQMTGGGRRIIPVRDYDNVASPEISPDNKWIAFDGASHGEPSSQAHLLFFSLETAEIRDLGSGCMPNWSADGRRIAYCKYGEGVFVRNFEGNGEDEESIDPQGWAIQFSIDGLQIAWVRGNNIMIQNISTGEKRSVFADGMSPYRSIEHNMEWSPDSSRIAFRGHRPLGAVDIATVSTTGDAPHRHVCCDGKPALPDFAWHPDGKRLMFPQQVPGEKLQIYEVAPNADAETKPLRYPEQPKDQNNSGLCWSRDGKMFVFVSNR